MSAATESRVISWRRPTLTGAQRWVISACAVVVAGAGMWLLPRPWFVMSLLPVGLAVLWHQRAAAASARRLETVKSALISSDGTRTHAERDPAVLPITTQMDELRRRALYDSVTQLPNRTLFIEMLTRALDRMPVSRRPLAVMFVDLDGFKRVNDMFGHACGDQVLRDLSARVRRDLRKLDVLGRLGGDEFAVIINGMRRDLDAAVVAARVVAGFSAPVEVGDTVTRVGASVGVVVVRADARDAEPEELLRQADMAMYLAKRQGKGRFVIFDSASRDTIVASGENTAVSA